MKYLNKKATHVVIDLEDGFIFATHGMESENHFQACLMVRKDGKGYKKQIDKNDCGWDDGICGDYNESIGANTENHLNEFLNLAKKSGVLVI